MFLSLLKGSKAAAEDDFESGSVKAQFRRSFRRAELRLHLVVWLFKIRILKQFPFSSQKVIHCGFW
jgi:hypothetical protein